LFEINANLTQLGVVHKDVRTKSRTLLPLLRKMSHWLNPLFMRTHHKFRKIQSFWTKKRVRSHLKNPLIRKMSALDNPLLTADVLFMAAPYVVS